MIPADEHVLDAFRAARLAAQRHMAIMEAAGDTWGEESMTEILLAAGYPVVKFAKFTHHEERQLGGDWLWWWLDGSGEAFGMIVQAKRLKRLRNTWDIDFDYRNGEQRRALLQSARAVRLPPMYALYLGTSAWRGGAFCRDTAHQEPCEACERATVSLVPAIITTVAHGVHAQEVSLSLSASLPLEFVADPAVRVDPVWDPNLGDLDSELASLLREPQVGARRVAQMVFERVTRIRAMGFSGPTGTQVARGVGPIFKQLPDDYGHFSRQYYPEIIDGLRTEAPDYVFDMLADQALPDEISDRFAGVAVFSC